LRAARRAWLTRSALVAGRSPGALRLTLVGLALARLGRLAVLGGIRGRRRSERALELLRQIVRLELLEPHQLGLRGRAVAALEQRLAVVLARRRVLRLDRQAG